MTELSVEALRAAHALGEALGLPEQRRGMTHDRNCHLYRYHEACANHIINQLCEKVALIEERLQDEQAANIRLTTENRRLHAQTH